MRAALTVRLAFTNEWRVAVYGRILGWAPCLEGEELQVLHPESYRAAIVCLVGLITLCGTTAHAQKGALRGLVTDSAGTPIRDADVGIAALRMLTRTDDRGRFSFNKVPVGEQQVSVRRLSYEPRIVHVVIAEATVDSVKVVLTMHAALLAAVDVTAGEWRRREMIEEFYRRRVKGIGQYVTRDDIDKRWGGLASDLLRDKPGVRFVKMSGGGNTVRFPGTSIRNRDCPPAIWLDGQKAPGMEIDDVPLHDIEGIEIYNGPATTPTQFSQSQNANTCGTIVVWSRPPPPSFRKK